jgi:hypothetical protein
MRVMPLLAVVVAIGLSSIILAGFGLDFTEQSDLEDTLDEKSGEERDYEPDQDTGFLSFVSDAITQVGDLARLAIFLPGALADLGLPGPAASAIGIGVQLTITLALIQIGIQYTIK